MIDINLIVQDPNYVKEALKKRNYIFEPDEVISLYEKQKKIIQIVEKNNFERNKLSSEVGKFKNNNQKIKEISLLVNEIKNKNKSYNSELEKITEKIKKILLDLIMVLN